MAFDAESGNGGITPPRPVTPNSTRIMPSVPQATRTHSTNTRAQQPTGAHRAPTHMAPSKAAPNAGDSAPREPKNRKRGKIAAAIVGGIVVVVYIAGVIAFSNIYYPNTCVSCHNKHRSRANRILTCKLLDAPHRLRHGLDFYACQRDILHRR